MGRPKAGVAVDGQRLVDRAVSALRAGGCAPVLAVVRTGMSVDDATVVVNPDPERGMRSSLDLAVGVAEAAGVDALAVLLVDVPGIGAEAVRAVVEAWHPGRIAVGSFAGRRGHPTVMSPKLWRAALEMAGPDEGARELLRRCAELVDEIPVPGDPSDLDTPEDLARWQRRDS